MKKLLAAFLTILLFSCSFSSKSQQTGSFNDTINFNSETRDLSLYVPDNYDPNYAYKLLLGLHGLGDNSSNFRNALINTLDWKTHFPNTIFVFPDGGSDANKDFYTPSGDEKVIVAAINYVKSSYNIDTNQILLEGFSLGGRSALKYGLEHPDKFKGLILNTPAIQGVQDAKNNPLASLVYPYENASEIPIYITNGADDNTYLMSIELMYEYLVKNDAIVLKNTVPGMTHTIPAYSAMSNCLSFIDTPSHVNYDLELVKLELPNRSCQTDFTASCLLRNLGNKSIHSIELAYEIDGTTNYYQWNGQLDSFQHAEISIPVTNLNSGYLPFSIDIHNFNSSQTDTITSNNYLNDTVLIATQSSPLPIYEGFESNYYPPRNWVLNSSGNIAPWDLDNSVSSEGDASIYSFNTILLFYNQGDREEILSPLLDLTTASDPQLRFDVAFNYHKYTAPYFTQDVYFADTLEVYISFDCGQSFELLYKKGGADLATFDNPITNPLNINSCFISPKKRNWRTEVIDLADYKQMTSAIIKFSYVSALGGSIQLDNIQIDGPNSVSEQIPETDLKIYPNPATDQFFVSSETSNIESINIYDASGKLVQHNKVQESNDNISTISLIPGLYMLEVISDKGVNNTKLLIQK